MSVLNRAAACSVALILVACGGAKTTEETTAGSTGNGTSSGSASSTTGGTTTGGSSSSGGASSTAGSTSGSSSGSGTTTSGFQIAAHAPLPQVPRNNGPILASPEVVVVTYAGYPYDVKSYMGELVQSSWLSTVGADYGVGLGAVTGAVVLDGGPSGGPAAISDSEIVSLLTHLILDGGVPAMTENTVYVLAFPENTVVSDDLGTSCVSFGGYHNRFMLGDTWVPYCVIPTCASYPGSAITVEDMVGLALSHEFIEAATDPVRTTTVAGYHFLDPNDPWTYSGGEVADLCVQAPLYFAPDGGFVAQTVWSNSAAALGTGSPCVPASAGETYYNVDVEPQTMVVLDAGSKAQTVTYTITGWSTAPTADWIVYPSPIAGTIDPNQLNPLVNGTYQINLNNGRKATLTLTVPGGTPSGAYAAVAIFSAMTPNQVDYFGSFAMAAVQVQ